MSKKNKKANVNVETVEVEVLNDSKEENEMEKKGFIAGVKERINNAPMAAKIAGGILLGVTAVGGAAYAIFKSVTNTGDEDEFYDEDFVEEDDTEIDAAETETPADE